MTTFFRQKSKSAICGDVMGEKAILFVEDEVELLRIMAGRLEKEFKVFAATNGMEAWDYLQKERVDCVLLDIEMPVMNGVELLQRLRASGNYVHVIIATGKSCLSYAEKCAGLGVKSYITKPYTVEEVIKKIRSLPGPKERRSKARSRGLFHPKVREATRLIKNKYGDKISVSKIANQIGIAPDYLTVLFKKDLGLSVIQYINYFRVEKAKAHLKNLSLSIPNVMERTGFLTEQNFYKQFKKCTGCKPSDYRSGT